MKFLVVLALIYSASDGKKPLSGSETEFKRFQTKYNRNYNTAEKEEKYKNCFTENYNKIAAHNLEADRGKQSYRMAVNKFADMDNTEFRQKFNGYKPGLRKKQNKNVYIKTSKSLVTSVDWRTQGYVTPIKDQGLCGSCWAFSAVACIEGQHFKKTSKLVALSEQNLVDCSTDYGNLGCNGGLMSQAFDYIIAKGGVDTESSYPYTASMGTCSFNASSVGATITGYTKINSGDEDALMDAVCNIGPICVAIDASHETFQLYSSGVYDETACSSVTLDHGVTVVGYGTDNSTGKQVDYWLVRNSWGTSWGENGYIRMSRNKKNQCGIATMASYATGVN